MILKILATIFFLSSLLTWLSEANRDYWDDYSRNWKFSIISCGTSFVSGVAMTIVAIWKYL